MSHYITEEQLISANCYVSITRDVFVIRSSLLRSLCILLVERTCNGGSMLALVYASYLQFF
jgi:hypothetical protein